MTAVNLFRRSTTKSATTISYELDNIEAAVKELTSQIRDKLTFGKRSSHMIY